MSRNVLLLSTYELGRQPFGLASPAAWLARAGADVVVQDLSLCDLDERTVRDAALVGFYVPMHTATRLAQPVLARVKELNSEAHICFFGLYAALNDEHLRRLGADTILGGEFESGLVELYAEVVEARRRPTRQSLPLISLARQEFITPDREGLPPLEQYAQLVLPGGATRVVGYTEASRGCRHRCRHCPIVPVYDGRFRIVSRDVVVEDVRRQVEAGAEHITFGDPDFFNGPTHSLRLVRDIHAEFPNLSYDVTIKVEHLCNHIDLLPELKDTGCVLVTTAVESFDPDVLETFDKGHTVGDVEIVIDSLRDIGLAVNPTFVPFTPWTTIEGYADFLRTLLRLGIVENMSPVQYAIRLLIPAGSKLLDLPELASVVSEFDREALCHPWTHPDAAVDQLGQLVMAVVTEAQAAPRTRGQVFDDVWRVTAAAGAALGDRPEPPSPDVRQVVTIPYLTEPWYC